MSSTASEKRFARSTWHRRASKPVTIWLGALIIVGFIHWMIPNYRWVLIHIFTLGVVTNSIMLWSQHFTEKFLHQPLPEETRSWQLRRFYILNIGILITLVGQILDSQQALHWLMTCAGAVIVGASLGFHAYYLLRQYGQYRRSLSTDAQPHRYSGAVTAYILSALSLVGGAILGGLLAVPQLADHHESFLLTHLVFNILGFACFAVVGSLFLLFAAIWRTQSHKEHIKPVLAAMTVGIVLAVAGTLSGIQPLLSVGLVSYIGGILIASVGWGYSVVQVLKDPRDRIGFASLSIAAAPLWLIGSLVYLLYHSITASSVGSIPLPTIALLVGFLAQLLIGVMSFLLPTTIGGGAGAVRTGLKVYNRAGIFRATLVNAGLLLWLLSDNSWLKVGASILALGSLAVFFFFTPFAVKAQLGVIRKQRDPAEADTHPRWNQATAAVALIAVLMASTGAGASPSSVVSDGVPATGITKVRIAAANMRFSPDHITVPTGHKLLITLVNEDYSQVHDLKLANGAESGRLKPGEETTFEAGVITGSMDGWCTIAGHRQQGMVFAIEAGSDTSAKDAITDSTGTGDSHNSHAGMNSSHGDTQHINQATDLNQDLFYDPILPPAPASTTHRYTFDISELELPVAEGVTRGRWTFDGKIQGLTLRGKVGDIFEVTLINGGSISHSIDFHAGMVSPDEVMRSIAPGESLVYRFRAEHAGAWLYHCGTKPVSMHIAAGMFGAVIIDPPDLAPVDQEYIMVQSEVYGSNSTKEEPVDSQLLAAATPSATVFNGMENQYMEKPLHMKAGQTARFWLVNAGPNLSESFHIIGTQFHTTYKEGAYLLKDGYKNGGSQALDLLAAQGGFVEAVFPEPGTYTMVNHQFIDAERGAVGTITVE